MSATDVAAPPSGPNLQDVTSNALEEPVTSVTDPGPDGRNIADSVVIKKEVQITPPPDVSNDEIKVDIKPQNIEKSNDSEALNSDVNKAEGMDNISGQRPKGNAKVTEFRLPDKLEKDSGRGDDVITERSDRVVDIVKQSKLKENQKSSSQDLGDSLEFSVSRPLTETSVRDGTRFSYDYDRDKREAKSETDRDTSKSPFSVKVERKPLHTAQTRSHSDYYSKTPTTGRFTHLATSYGQFFGFPPDHGGKQMPRMRRPPKLVRLATVTMSPKTKPVPRGPSLYYEEPKKPKKVITWDEANEARPPLRIDMEGPGPTQYTPTNRPLNETNSPAWSFGSKCFIEKGGGSRTSWEKTWFQNPDIWTNKVDFYNDSAWPTPTHYRQRPVIGPRQRTMAEAPSFSIGVRRETTFSKKGSNKEPSPVDYDKDIADKVTLNTAPSFTHQLRRGGTVIWSSKDKGPGPGSYNPNFSYNKHHGPSFSIRSLRREKSHVLGPFSTF